MSEDLSSKIKQIVELLGEDKIADNIQSLLSVLANSKSENENSSSSDQDLVSKDENRESEQLDSSRELDNSRELTDNTDVVHRIKKLADTFNQKNDPRINLLYAIKPFLKKERQSRISQCVNVLRISSVTRLINEKDRENIFGGDINDL